MYEFRRSLDLSSSVDDMRTFHNIRVIIRHLIEEHLDLKVRWRKQSDDARDAFIKAVSQSRVVLFICY
jgi:hypothetical protein